MVEPLRSLGWRGNVQNILWAEGRCVPIDAQVARRPPKLLVREMDQKAARLLELVLLDRQSCQDVLLAALKCNKIAFEKVQEGLDCQIPSRFLWDPIRFL